MSNPALSVVFTRAKSRHPNLRRLTSLYVESIHIIQPFCFKVRASAGARGAHRVSSFTPFCGHGSSSPMLVVYTTRPAHPLRNAHCVGSFASVVSALTLAPRWGCEIITILPCAWRRPCRFRTPRAPRVWTRRTRRSRYTIRDHLGSSTARRWRRGRL